MSAVNFYYVDVFDNKNTLLTIVKIYSPIQERHLQTIFSSIQDQKFCIKLRTDRINNNASSWFKLNQKSNTKLMMKLEEYKSVCVSFYEYKNQWDYVIIICLMGHCFKKKINPLAIPRSNQGYVWCNECYIEEKNQRFYNEMRKLAEDKNGRLLSDEYTGCDAYYKWMCHKNHTWKAKWGDVKQGTWCPHCNGNARLTIEYIRQVAIEKGGECLSNVYKNANDIFWWRCHNKHVFNATVKHVLYDDTWCSTCRGIIRRDLNDMKNIAKERGGECLSIEYKGTKHKLLWRCKYLHEWESAPAHIIRGTWCPDCKYKNESMCRKLIEEYTNKKFPRSRPSWLGGLELDGYCKELNLAFEYNGKQHYEYSDFFHRGDMENLHERMEDDILKLRLCVENNVILIVIPYWEDPSIIVEQAAVVLSSRS